MLFQSPCPACKGTGKLEYEEELWFDGTWRRRTGVSEDTLWPLLVESRPDLARYQLDTCEVCHGDREITLESVPCKIF